MTEDEAKTKWCPFSRTIVSGSRGLATGNRFGHDITGKEVGVESGPLCVASGCMAWRWSGQPKPPPLSTADFALGVLGNDEQRADVMRRVAATLPGFCGLAGAPS